MYRSPNGCPCHSSKILEAITTLRCCESFSLERLELLGDSVLKYALSCHLFLNYPKKHEGQLSDHRSWAVCNSTLHRLGISRYLQVYELSIMLVALKYFFEVNWMYIDLRVDLSSVALMRALLYIYTYFVVNFSNFIANICYQVSKLTIIFQKQCPTYVSLCTQQRSWHRLSS